jgi:hypothetical protein
MIKNLKNSQAWLQTAIFSLSITIQIQNSLALPNFDTEFEAIKSPYQLMGRYEGLRFDSQKVEKITLNFQKYDYTAPGIRLFFRADPLTGEKPVKADHFIWETSLSLDQYRLLFDNSERVKNLSIGPHQKPNPNDLYEINIVNAQTDESTGLRTITLERTVGDYGKVTRKYLSQFVVKDSQITSVSHKKYLKKKFYLFGDGFDLVANFQNSKTLSKTADGLELLDEYNVRLKVPENIESAALDSTPKNFKRLEELEKQENNETTALRHLDPHFL